MRRVRRCPAEAGGPRLAARGGRRKTDLRAVPRRSGRGGRAGRNGRAVRTGAPRPRPRHPPALHPPARPVPRVHRGLPPRRPRRRGGDLPAGGASLAASLPRRGRPRIPHPRSAVAHPERRRGPAHQPHHRPRNIARQHPVRARRAERRTPPPRPRPHGRGAAPVAGRGQHHPRGRARRPGDPGRRPGPRPRAGSGRGRRRDRLRGPARGARTMRRIAHRRLPERPAPDRGRRPRRTAASRSDDRGWCVRAGRKSHQ